MEGRGYLQETEAKTIHGNRKFKSDSKKRITIHKKLALLGDVGVRISKEHYDRCAMLCLNAKIQPSTPSQVCGKVNLQGNQASVTFILS